MNRDKRQFVHELAPHFGCETASFDAEPKRNVVATAYRDRIFMPSQSVVEVVTKIKRALKPIVNSYSSRYVHKNNYFFPLTGLFIFSNFLFSCLSSAATSFGNPTFSPLRSNSDAKLKEKSVEPEKVIDYFDD